MKWQLPQVNTVVPRVEGIRPNRITSLHVTMSAKIFALQNWIATVGPINRKTKLS